MLQILLIFLNCYCYCCIIAPSYELSPPEDEVDGLPQNGRADHRYNSVHSLSSLNDNDNHLHRSTGLTAADRRGSQSSLSSVETKHDRKHKLNIRRVLRKHSKESGDRSPTFDKKSPSSSRKVSSNAGDASPPRDSVSQHESDQDIDAMFKDYENEQAKTTPQEFTGACLYDSPFHLIFSTIHVCISVRIWNLIFVVY